MQFSFITIWETNVSLSGNSYGKMFLKIKFD